VAVRARPELRLLRLRGDDQREWLNGQVTADVRDAKPGDGIYALVVNVRGKILSDAWVIHEAAGLSVLLPDATYATVRDAFDKQIIMEDVELEDAAAPRVLSLVGPRAKEAAARLTEAAVFGCDELGLGGVFLLANDETESNALATRATQIAIELGGGALDEAGFELARIRAGRPRLFLDFADRNYPQEAGLKGLAVSFSKGCYIGQEVVCTLEHRGRLTKRLVRLQSRQALAKGDELRDSSQQAIGEVTSAAFDPEVGQTIALGYVKSAHAAVDAELKTAHATVEVLGTAGAD
jgi:folate-binding protein YgfZ